MSDNNTEKVKLDDLVKDDDIYPREKPSSETVKSFADSLEAGYADFPKIQVQRLVLESGEEELAIIDGVHRRDAYQEYNERVEDEKRIEKIEAEPVIREDPVPKSEHLTELRVEAIKANLEHGDRLSREDKKKMCRRMAEDDPEMEITEKEFSDIFGCLEEPLMIGWMTFEPSKKKAETA
ncbi:hypothetical protein AKJ39_02805 [candidate division MSBL1 archaeon SCGC-AAA259J03]|uniref:ParB/Sulfiredoxin domain-containing protein n=1 Tax=candidate division MSBL1 archaeon SCGC-AAA259J03 TaxID=1698269 RepID=A0A656YW44_9EURY|nr:hypothetical protein AKJ39_02805 [candidate division MSBL1 archaeon SCGC-AAA259J03]